MKYFSRKELTKTVMEEMCDIVKFGSKLHTQTPFGLGLNAETELKRLIDAGLLNSGSHLQQGIHRLGYSDEEVYIEEIPLQYPDSRLIKAVEEGRENKDLLGPMTGVFAHYYGNGLYAFQVRGTKIAAPGKIQLPAGMGEYLRYPPHTAQKEVAEEIYGAKNPEEIKKAIKDNEMKFAIEGERFLDITPFMKSGKFPQPLFSYVFTGRTDKISPVINSNSELEKFVETLPKERLEEATPCSTTR